MTTARDPLADELMRVGGVPTALLAGRIPGAVTPVQETAETPEPLWRREVLGKVRAGELLARGDYVRAAGLVRDALGATHGYWWAATVLLTKPDHGTLPDLLSAATGQDPGDPDPAWHTTSRAISHLLALAPPGITAAVVRRMDTRGRRLLALSTRHRPTLAALLEHADPAVIAALAEASTHPGAPYDWEHRSWLHGRLLDRDDPATDEVLAAGGVVDNGHIAVLVKRARGSYRECARAAPGASWTILPDWHRTTVLKELWDAEDPGPAAQALRAPLSLFQRLYAARTLARAGRFDLLTERDAGTDDAPAFAAAKATRSPAPLEAALAAVRSTDAHQRELALILNSRYANRRTQLGWAELGRAMAAEPWLRVDWPAMLRATDSPADRFHRALLQYLPGAEAHLPPQLDSPPSAARIVRDRARAEELVAAGPVTADAVLTLVGAALSDGSAVDCGDLVRWVRPVGVLLAAASGGTLPEVEQAALDAALREAVRGTAGSADTWAAVHHLLRDFPGTLPELLDTARLMTSRSGGP